MRAVRCQAARLDVVDLPAPQPEKGQVLLEVLRCGICGSDLHARHHCDALAGMMREVGYDDFMRSEQSVVFGHELSGRVAEYGPGCRRELPAGVQVVALPLVRRGEDVHAMGLSAAAPGAYAEQVVVQEALMMPVPNGLSPEMSALTEPLAIGWHAVRRSEIGKRDVAVVIGCGPIGLAVICLLKARGVHTIVASDFSAARRQLATACGADVTVDPAHDSPFAAGHADYLESLPAAVDLTISTMEKLRRLPLPWHHVWRTIETLGIKPKRPVVFECVGMPGVIDGIVSSAPLLSRVVVVGVCMGEDRLRPAMAVNKELDLRFVVGYSPLEFRDTLHMLADGKVDPAPLLTGTVGLAGVAGAFDALGNPEVHAKILIDPGSPATVPVPVPAA
jgi:threonine dehydrogenase-like Zn-dependent dehydrogenase